MALLLVRQLRGELKAIKEQQQTVPKAMHQAYQQLHSRAGGAWAGGPPALGSAAARMVSQLPILTSVQQAAQA